jgi:hypothetical protein
LSQTDRMMLLFGVVSLAIAVISFGVYFTTPSVAIVSLLVGTVFFLLGFACVGVWAWKRSLAKNEN